MTARVAHPVARAGGKAETVRTLVRALGGRYSTELGIDVDAGDAEVERWFVAATLFGTRISAAVAARTFRVLDAAGLRRISAARAMTWDDLVVLLDRGGYVRYDYRTATRLQTLAEVVDDRYGGSVAALAASARSPAELMAALDALPGWGDVTVSVFLRELRGVWRHAVPPVDGRAWSAARHLHLARGAVPSLARLTSLAADAAVDVRDLESGLVRLTLSHGRDFETCPGGVVCTALG